MLPGTAQLEGLHPLDPQTSSASLMAQVRGRGGESGAWPWLGFPVSL
jgi:hypothetical protein